MASARLDSEPELLFTLRQVDQSELIEQAGQVGRIASSKVGAKTIAADDVADVFGIELEPAVPAAANPPAVSVSPAKKARPAQDRPRGRARA